MSTDRNTFIKSVSNIEYMTIETDGPLLTDQEIIDDLMAGPVTIVSRGADGLDITTNTRKYNIKDAYSLTHSVDVFKARYIPAQPKYQNNRLNPLIEIRPEKARSVLSKDEMTELMWTGSVKTKYKQYLYEVRNYVVLDSLNNEDGSKKDYLQVRYP